MEINITEHILSKGTKLRVLRLYVRSTITHILDNLKHMHTAIGTRSYFTGIEATIHTSQRPLATEPPHALLTWSIIRHQS